MKYHVDYLGGLKTKITHSGNGQEIFTDAPKDNGGEGSTFSPTDLLAASLASCMMTLMGLCAKKLNLNLEGATMEVEKVMSAAPRRIGTIILTFRSPLAPSDKEKALLEKAALECPVHKSLHPDMIITTQFLWG